MTTPPEATIEQGLAAWAQGDMDALERILHPDVTLHALEPGPWDCKNRDEVMALLRARTQQRREAGRDIAVSKTSESTFIVTGVTGRKGTATQATVQDGLVTSLRQVTATPRDAVADQAVAATRSGDLTTLASCLDDRPELATTSLPGYGGRTLLHIVADWPGYWPAGPEIVTLLIARGGRPEPSR